MRFYETDGVNEMPPKRRKGMRLYWMLNHSNRRQRRNARRLLG